jgi:hypothetical protein
MSSQSLGGLGSAVPLTRRHFQTKKTNGGRRGAVEAYFHEPIDQWATQDSNL